MPTVVSDTTVRPARARSPEEKGQRRDDILRAAEQLWTRTPHADLSMNQVAREAGLAKGTLYLYFDTREELFLALLTEHLRAWVGELTTRLDERRPATPGEVADANEIRPGTGGEEAALFAGDLLRMYQRHAEAQGWRFQLLDLTETELGGVKEATARIEGEGVFARLKRREMKWMPLTISIRCYTPQKRMTRKSLWEKRNWVVPQ